MTDELLEPVKAYKEIYADKVREEAESTFDLLASKVDTPVELNRVTVKEIKTLKGELQELRNTISNYNGLTVFLIVFSF